MTKKKLSIKWNVFFCLLLFAGAIILILWLCQVVFLDSIYKAVKMNEIKDGAARITSNINSEALGDIIDDVGGEDICISLYEVSTPGIMKPCFERHTLGSCVIHSIDSESHWKLYEYTVRSGGVATQRFMYDSQRRLYIGIEGDFFDKPGRNMAKSKLPESIIYTTITNNAEGETLFVILNSEISPVDATVNTLNKILIVITLLLVLLALVLALIISMRVTKPIVRLTGEAKKLAREDYSAKFNEDGYREVAELSEALERAKQELERVDVLRRELIANISHDLRTPLTMIGGYSEMMRDIPGENNAENAQIILDETKRLSSLVNDVLDISRLQSGTGNLEIRRFCITNSVKETLERLSKLCEKNGYVIDFFYDEDAYVSADEKRITQVIYNLVLNAVTHTGPTMDVKVRQILTDTAVRIEVEDSGEGISPEDMPLIWDRYYKVDKVHKRAAMGSGLGLSIVKTIMEQSGGAYGVTSTSGSGSIFFIELEREKTDELDT